MEVINYLKEFGINKLVSEYSIKVKEYDEGLMVLNYDQINSPKSHPIVKECRGLILDKEFNVVSRSFDRFFNLGEQPETQSHINMNKAICFEKIDGSLIRIYYWKGLWRIATRGTVFGESEVNGFPITFKELVLNALGETYEDFNLHCNIYFNRDVSYICEVVSRENRVVKQYNGYHLYYLAARNNLTYQFVDETYIASTMGMLVPEPYMFNSTEACLETAKHLKDLEEGYVLYQDGIPVCKIKSPVYVAVHNIRGEGLSPKRICQIVLTGEHEEYLTYFNEDRHFFTPYITALVYLKEMMQTVYESVEHIADQKEFAIAVKDHSFSSVLFQSRKLNEHTNSVFEKQTEQHKIRLLEEAVN